MGLGAAYAGWYPELGGSRAGGRKGGGYGPGLPCLAAGVHPKSSLGFLRPSLGKEVSRGTRKALFHAIR